MDQIADGVLVLTIYLTPLFMMLAVCGILADYVLPHCPRLLHLLERAFDVDLGGDDFE